MKPEEFVKLCHERVLVFDGAMGTTLQKKELTLDDFAGKEGCNEILVLIRPQIISEIHAAYFDAGCDIVETNTFGANPVVLAEYQLADKTYEINKKAAMLAKNAAGNFSTPSQPRFVAGSIGPGTKLASLGQISLDSLRAGYEEQCRGLIEGGVDIILIETAQDPLQIKAAILGSRDAMKKLQKELPVMVQVTMETTGTMLLGTEIGALTTIMEPFNVQSLGMNCATGPKEMTEHVATLSSLWPGLLSTQPNAGLPENVGGRAVYRLTPDELASDLAHFIKEYGVNIVGGCCGTTPEHMKTVVRAIKNLTPEKRDLKIEPGVASLYVSMALEQTPPPFVVGERTNVNGSKEFREFLLKNDYDTATSFAKYLSRDGVHALDVSVAFAGRNEKTDMSEIIKRFALNIKAPLMIDSTDPAVTEEALKLIGGRAIVNSINLEDGEDKLGRICDIARTYGAAVVALTIDEEGMARTAGKKLAVAKRIYELATVKHRLRAEDLIFDPLTFTLATGDEESRVAGMETLEALTLIKKTFPGVHTLLGVSNISFGLGSEARAILNSVFLEYAVKAGLDLAIVNAAKIMPGHKIVQETRKLAEDLIFNRRADGSDPLNAYINYFAQAAPKKAQETSKLTVEERLKLAIIDGDRKDLPELINKALLDRPAIDIINNILLDAMKTVGEMFGRGELVLPFVLASAEVMKDAISLLKPHMPVMEAESSKGIVVLATVKGDVHDIGKNLVDIIFTNNGYKVINLGIKQPLESILKASEEHSATAIGMSGLLVKSTRVMKENTEEMEKRGVKLPVLLGGAALTKEFVEKDIRSAYHGQVFYCKDAFEGLKALEDIKTSSQKSEGRRQNNDETVVAQFIERRLNEPTTTAPNELGNYTALSSFRIERRSKTPEESGSITTTAPDKPVPERLNQGSGNYRSAIRNPQSAITIPHPAFWGTRLSIGEAPLEEIFAYLNKIALINVRWGFKRSVDTKGVDPEEILKRWQQICVEEKLLEPKIVWGYFPCRSDGDSLVVFQEDAKTERLRFNFPRQKQEPFLCLSDFFAGENKEGMDILGVFVASVGPKATERAKTLFSAGKYQDYFYLHGLGVETAEALAEYWHKRMRVEMKIDSDDAPNVRGLFQQKYQGSRYSFGYPACPELNDQAKLWELLQPERIGVELTESYQMVPEQSVSAIVVHHPQAKYFSV